MTNDYLQNLASGPLLGKAKRAALLPPRKSTGEAADPDEVKARRANTAAARVAAADRNRDRIQQLANTYAEQGMTPARSFTLVDGTALLEATKAANTSAWRRLDENERRMTRADYWLERLRESGQRPDEAEIEETRAAAGWRKDVDK